MNEVFVFRIPPKPDSRGHRAELWDRGNPVFTGRIKVLQKGKALMVQIFAPKKGAKPDDANIGGNVGAASDFELFAMCPIELAADREKPQSDMDFFVEKVQDSSRYFAVRIVDGKSGRSTHVGIGFRERNDTFSFVSTRALYILLNPVRF